MKKIIFVVLLFIGWYACSDESHAPSLPEISRTSFLDTRDSSVYECIVVDGVTWMAENLHYRMPLGSYDGCYSFLEEQLDSADFSVAPSVFVENVKMALTSGELVDPTGMMSLFLDYVEMGFYDIDTFISFYDSTPEVVEDLNEIKEASLELSITRTLEETLKKAELANGGYMKNFGFLYTYDAALKALPEGWVLPTDEDWKALEKALGMPVKELDQEEVWRGAGEGLLLKEGEEGCGFNARMGGGKLYGTFPYTTQYHYLNSIAYFWTSSKKSMNDSTQVAYIRKLNYTEDRVFRGTSSLIGTAYSVRGIKK